MTGLPFVSALSPLARRSASKSTLPAAFISNASTRHDSTGSRLEGRRHLSLSFTAKEETPVVDKGSDISANSPLPKPKADNEKEKQPSVEELRRRYTRVDDQIHQLLINPALYAPLRRPRYPIVLCHGLYGFDVKGPSSFPKLQMHYWNNVLSILRKQVGAEVIVTSVPPTASVVERAHDLDRTLRNKAYGRGVNFMAHSMGGLDCRHLISHIKPTEYTPLSLMSISTPHRGSPFMDWCEENLGLGRITADTKTTSTVTEKTSQPGGKATEKAKKVETKIELSALGASLASLPASFTSFLLSILDSPAYGNLTTSFCVDDFNAQTPDDPNVRYFSVAGRSPTVNIWHPLWLPKMVSDAWERKERERLRAEGHPIAALDSEWGNDGLVTIQSARWGEFLGTVEGCDHWEIRGARGVELDIDIPALQAVSLSIPSVTLRDWNWPEWLSAWRRKGDQAKTEAEAKAYAAESVQVEAMLRDAATKADSEAMSEPRKPSSGGEETESSSNERLSTVFNWVAEHSPTDAIAKVTAQVTGSSGESAQDVEAAVQGTNRKGERNELATKADLERFYVALCRKLYDEGL